MPKLDPHTRFLPLDVPKVFDADGKTLCRWCERPITAANRKTYCSNECSHHYRIRSDNRYVRWSVWNRDAGVCAVCTRRTADLNAQWRTWCETYPGKDVKSWGGFDNWKFPRAYNLAKTWWEADHIVPIKEGGGMCGLEGLQTLCVPCHFRKTYRIRKRNPRDTSSPSSVAAITARKKKMWFYRALFHGYVPYGWGRRKS